MLIPLLKVAERGRITDKEVLEDEVLEQPKLVLGVFHRPVKRAYFVQAGEDGPIKIGISGDIGRRLAELQEQQRNLLPAERMNPYYDGLYVRRIIAFDLALGDRPSERAERLLHQVFRYCRLKGEWFKPDAALMWFIDLPLMWPLLLNWLQSREDCGYYPLKDFRAYVSTVGLPLRVGAVEGELVEKNLSFYEYCQNPYALNPARPKFARASTRSCS